MKSSSRHSAGMRPIIWFPRDFSQALQSLAGFAGSAVKDTEFLKEMEGIDEVRAAVTLADEFGIEAGPVGKVDVGEEATVCVVSTPKRRMVSLECMPAGGLAIVT